MIRNINFRRGKRLSKAHLVLKSVMLCTMVWIGMHGQVQAQEILYTKPSVWFGVAGGANFADYHGSTQILNDVFTAPVAFHGGDGVGLYLAPLVEFHHPDATLGFMLQAGYDSRKGSFDNQTAIPCNCPADLSADIGYLTLEPSLRVAPFKSNFYLYAGPRLALNVAKSFTYEEGINPDFPNELPEPDVDGDFSNVDKYLLSMQIGAGYDIPLSTQNQAAQMVLSPFVAFHPDFGQDPRTIETWHVSALRAGVAIKLGFGHKIPVHLGDAESPVRFSVFAPRNITVERMVREVFPLRNYVFFNPESTEIPDRYVLLNPGQVKDFKEDQLGPYTPKTLSGRSDRQMTVYYNVLNILGDRMGKLPSSTITLVGSSVKGPEDGRAMAGSIKEYLTDVFRIDASRISIEGRDKPKIPSERPGATRELDLLREGDQRVSIESSSPALLMKFQSGPDAPLKPVVINAKQTAPLDSYVTFNAPGAKKAFSSWTVEVMDDKGKVQYFGPYTQERVSVPGKAILGTRPQADYKVTMVGQAKSGKTVKQTVPVHMVLWTPDKNVEGMRYSVLYEFDEAKAILLYDKYLTDIVTPGIPKDATVIIHGYTDIIGDAEYNENLSRQRALDVKNIISGALAKTGRTDVKFEVHGFGEDETLSLFANRLPEERFYNRSVVIDIIPKM